MLLVVCKLGKQTVNDVAIFKFDIFCFETNESVTIQGPVSMAQQHLQSVIRDYFVDLLF